MNSDPGTLTKVPLPDLAAKLGERSVMLSDGRTGLRSGLQVEVSEPADDTEPSTLNHQSSTIDSLPVLDFIASDETLDRCDEVISAGGWRLDSYRRNPVFQNAHQYGDIIFTLGKALITEVRSASLGTRHSPPVPYLFQRVQFAIDANPMARIAYALYKGKFLNAVSVGFIPLRWADGDSTEAPSLDTRRSTLPFIRRRYLEQELLEVSAVGIPANPNALQLGLKTGAIQKADLRDMLELLETVLNSSVANPSSQSRCLEPDAQRLLTLARDVWQVLKG